MFNIIWFVMLIGLSTPMQFKSNLHEFKTVEECTEYGKLHEPKMDYYFKGMLGVVAEAPTSVSFVCLPKEDKKPEIKA